MITPGNLLETASKKWKKEYTMAFLSTVVLALLVHLPIMVSDYPNHDGLDSLYFSQNMISSGRWFLSTACSISSFYALPWVISLLGILYLGLTSVCLTALLELKSKLSIVLVSGLLVSFPALCSTFAYVFTLDGYMLALLLTVAAVLVTKVCKKGFLPGAVLLGSSMGIYQAYLPVAILLCLYLALVLLCDKELEKKEKINQIVRYILMGVLALIFYYCMLYLLLFLEGESLSAYQRTEGTGLMEMIKQVYDDFVSFTLKSKIIFSNVISAVACGLLFVVCLAEGILAACKRGFLKKPLFYLCVLGTMILVPLFANFILLASPGVTYHLLMRYHWVVFFILAVAFLENRIQTAPAEHGFTQWILLCAGVVLVFHYAVTDNIGYSNLSKKYEKTYAYCVRLLDRIEQTEGYYQGIPVALIGVISDEEFPATDITNNVTGSMIGISGDWLLYTGDNYEKFIRNYLGASLNVVGLEYMEDIYYSKAYQELDPFPGPNATKVVDGILYVHTENIDRTLSFE